MVKTLAWFAAGLPLLVTTVVNGYAAPGECSGICTNAHDPSIIQSSNGTYYRFSTGNNVSVHSAPDITGPWEFKGPALPDGSSIDLKGRYDLWAPDVHKVGDFYYLYYSVSSFGTQNSAIGVARSSSLDGPWEDAGSTSITSDSTKPYNAIDPNLIEADGDYYLTFGSYWQGIHQAHMRNPPFLSSSDPVQIGFTSDFEVLEGPFIFQHGDYYYLFMSKGKCCTYDKTMPAKGKEYRILACRSSTVTGGFVDKDGVDCTKDGGTVVLETHDDVYGPGGQGVYNDPKFGPILYYHYVNITIGYADGDKRFGWNTIDFSSGWPVV
ncbi:arabinan endo-1 [Phytophthora cinnamomi]|uniref:arabinan endo-1 n=1 Tax=Phytophthora cinnamomi TaxID=4785 RepID=UPI00355A213E|nr:arabinan endo-1 [Phytophthora cinnamomi]